MPKTATKTAPRRPANPGRKAPKETGPPEDLAEPGSGPGPDPEPPGPDETPEPEAEGASQDRPALDGITVAETTTRKAGRPSLKEADFFRRMTAHPSKDWQDGRLIIYAYRLEPFTDRHQGGAKYAFLMKYTSPIDEETILLDHGSGKYRFMLNKQQEGTNRYSTIDAKELEILHPQHPPKVPPGEWVNDPRNKKWAWAAPKDAAAGTVAATSDPVTMAREIMQEIRAGTPAPKQSTAGEMAELIKAVKPDPAEYVKTLTQMRDLAGGQQTTVTDLLRDELKSIRDELKEERATTRRLLEKLATTTTAAPPPKPPDMVETLDGIFRMIDKVKEKFGGGDSAGQAQRSHMTGWQEFFAPIAERVAEALAPAAAAMLTPGATVPGMAPNPAGTPPGAAAPGADLAGHLRIMQAVREPMLSFLNNGQTGGDFAAWFVDGYGDLQYQAIRGAGAEMILATFRRSPMWRTLAPVEQRFTQFIREFAEYDTEGTEPPEPAPPEDLSGEPPIDLTTYVDQGEGETTP